MMHCNGQCQMMKKLRQQENKEKENPDRKLDNKYEVISSKSFFTSITYTAVKVKQQFFSRNNNLVSDIAPDIFHPPA